LRPHRFSGASVAGQRRQKILEQANDAYIKVKKIIGEITGKVILRKTAHR
jgi:hypothetical protein